MQVLFSKKFLVISAIIIVLVFGYGIFQYFSLASNFKKVKEDFAFEQRQLLDVIEKVKGELLQEQEENTNLLGLLEEEKERNDEFGKQIQSITSTVGVLEKLSKTDEELLQKYSKVYFLNENYIPTQLVQIDKKYLYEKNKEMLIHTNVQKYLYAMMDAADSHGTPLQIVSAYRSFDQQDSLKTSYRITYGAGANKFAADQGYSEHQLATAVDFTVPKLGSAFTNIASEPVYKWLLEHAHEYGFILSYPKGNSYYYFEPWHWRFVGVNLATELHNRGQYFYDMPQREIDTFLIDIFDE